MAHGPVGSPYARNAPSKAKPPKEPGRSALHKQAVVYAAEQTLKPWEVQKPPKQPAPAPFKAAPVRQAPLRTRYRAALAAPVNAPIKVGGKTVPARQYLAETMTPKRRAEYHQSYQPPPKTQGGGLLGGIAALGKIESRVAHAIPGLAAHAAVAPLESLARNAISSSYQAQQPQRGPVRIPKTVQATAAGAAAAIQPATDLGLGPNITKFLQGRPYSDKGLAFEATLLPLGLGGRPIRVGKALAEAFDVARGVKSAERAGVFRKAFSEALARSSTAATAEAETARAGPAATQTAIAEPIPRVAQPERVTQSGVVLPRGVRSVALPTKAEPLTAEQGGAELMRGQGQATNIIREQKVLRSEEMAQRARNLERMLKSPEYAGEAGRQKAQAALAGMMPTLHWDRFTEMNPATVDAMDAYIRQHPSFEGRPLDMNNTLGGLQRIVSGQLPRPFEQKLLRQVFGDQATEEMLASVNFWKKWGIRGLNVVAIPRTLMASMDMSFPLRQGLVLGVTHPVIWGRGFKPMLKAFGSTAVHETVQQGIFDSPNYDLYQRMRVPFTDMGSRIGRRDEAFQSSLAETMTGGKYSPVRASNRSYVTFGNYARQKYADWLIERLKLSDPELDLNSAKADKVLRQLGDIIGTATGRGTVHHQTLESAMPLLNQIFFAPRLLTARLKILAYPATMWTMHPVARQEAFKQLAGLVGTVGGILTLAKLAGARVSQDPRNADWAKIRVGNTRFDIAAGFQQPLRLMAQVGSKTVISSTTGKPLRLTAGGGFGKLSQRDIIQRFVETKLAPTPSFLNDYFRGTDFTGKPFSVKLAAYQRLTPLLFQDAADLYRQGDSTAGNIAKATAVYGIGMWGIGTQTYGPKPLKASSAPKPREYGGNVKRRF